MRGLKQVASAARIAAGHAFVQNLRADTPHSPPTHPTQLRLPAALSRDARLAALLGRDFADNSVPVNAARDGFHLTGLIGLPTLIP